MNTDKLTEELKKRINYCNTENPDDRNWRRLEGVLLSVNEAKHFLHLLSLPKETDAVEFAEWCLKNTIGFDKERNVALYIGYTGRYNKTIIELYNLFLNKK